MKINVLPIVREHWSTLYDDRSNRLNMADFVMFLGVPAIAGLVLPLTNWRFTAESFNVSITFFGIFIALLLNIQVAIFGIFQRKWTTPESTTSQQLVAADLKLRREILGEINTNISYLTVFCSAALCFFLFVFSFGIKGGVATGIAIFIYIHFLATFLMIVKRSHALFQKEYTESPD